MVPASRLEVAYEAIVPGCSISLLLFSAAVSAASHRKHELGFALQQFIQHFLQQQFQLSQLFGRVLEFQLEFQFEFKLVAQFRGKL